MYIVISYLSAFCNVFFFSSKILYDKFYLLFSYDLIITFILFIILIKKKQVHIEKYFVIELILGNKMKEKKIFDLMKILIDYTSRFRENQLYTFFYHRIILSNGFFQFILSNK
jgi:hypothetical protein